MYLLTSDVEKCFDGAETKNETWLWFKIMSFNKTSKEGLKPSLDTFIVSGNLLLWDSAVLIFNWKWQNEIPNFLFPVV